MNEEYEKKINELIVEICEAKKELDRLHKEVYKLKRVIENGNQVQTDNKKF